VTWDKNVDFLAPISPHSEGMYKCIIVPNQFEISNCQVKVTRSQNNKRIYMIMNDFLKIESAE
jgi:hypothetical protein